MAYNKLALFSDAFARADEANLLTPWSNGIGEGADFQLLSGTVQPTDVNQDSCVYLHSGSHVWPRDQYASATLTSPDQPGNNAGPGLCVRRSAGDRSYYRLTVNHNTGSNPTVWIIRFDAGVETALASVIYSWTDGAAWELRVTGGAASADITALCNGVAVLTYTDSSPVTAGWPGMAYSSSASGSVIDNFECGFLAWDFPTTPVLDSFTGADENPITTNWTAPLFSSDFSLQRLSNQLAGSAGAWNGAYYDLATFGPATELYATLATIPGNNDGMSMWGKAISPGGTSVSGYLLHPQKDSAGGPDDNYSIERIDAGSVTALDAPNGLGPAFNLTKFANGDAMGIRVYNGTIEAWIKRVAGSWSILSCSVDTTYETDTGVSLGIEMFDITGRWDDVGGGNVSITAEEPETASSFNFAPVIAGRGAC